MNHNKSKGNLNDHKPARPNTRASSNNSNSLVNKNSLLFLVEETSASPKKMQNPKPNNLQISLETPLFLLSEKRTNLLKVK